MWSVDYLTVWNSKKQHHHYYFIMPIELFIVFYIMHLIGSLLLMYELPSQLYKEVRVATVYSNYSFVGTLPAPGFLKNSWTK